MTKKLYLRSKFGNGKATQYWLHDENGEVLPRQSKVVMESGTDAAATVTVTFVVGGDFIICSNEEKIND